jgi:hypothetical protein
MVGEVIAACLPAAVHNLYLSHFTRFGASMLSCPRASCAIDEHILWQLAIKGLYRFPEGGAAEFFKKTTKCFP